MRIEHRYKHWFIALPVTVVQIILVPVMMVSMSLSTGYASTVAPQYTSVTANPEHALLVDAVWLNTHLFDHDLIIVDTRERKLYDVGHIENAVNIPVSETFNSKPRDDLVASISQIQREFSEAGIDASMHVVLYDDGIYTDAARVFWVMEVYGHRKVSLLNGGFANWRKIEYPLSTLKPQVHTRNFIPEIVPERLSTKFSTRLALTDSSKLLIDARSADEYTGKTSKYTRAGHIPSAINIPFNLNYQVAESGVSEIMPIEKLRQIYADVDPAKKVIAYCNRGKQSALTYFILRRLGFSVAAYDGSWIEWSADLSLPVETELHETEEN